MAAKNTISQRIALEGSEEIKVALAAIGKAGEQAFSAIKAAAEKTSIGSGSRLDASITNLRSSLARLSEANANIGRSFAAVGVEVVRFQGAVQTTVTRLGLLTGALTGAGLAAAAFVKSAIDTADAADRQAQALGISIEAYTGLSAAAAASNVDQGEFAAGLLKLTNEIQAASEKAAEAAQKASEGGKALGDTFKAVESVGVFKELEDGATSAEKSLVTVRRGLVEYGKEAEKAKSKSQKATEQESDAFKKLGIDIREFMTLSPEAQIFSLADAFQRLGDTPERTAIGFDLLGRNALRLIPFLAQGSSAIRRQIEDYRRFGVVLTEADKQLAALGDNGLDRFALAIQGLRLQLGLVFAPLTGEGANAFADFLAENLEGMKARAREIEAVARVLVFDVIETLKGLDADVENKWLLDLRDGITTAAAIIETVIEGIVLSFKGISLALEPVAAVINGIFGTRLTGTTLLVSAAILKLTGAFRVLSTGARLAFSIFTSGFAVFVNGRVWILALAEAARSLYAALAIVVPAIGSLILANPLVAALIIATAGLAGSVAYLALRQDSAAVAAQAHESAIGELNAAFADVEAGVPGAVQRLEELKQKHYEAARAAIEDAKAQIEWGRGLENFLPPLAEGQAPTTVDTDAQNLANKAIRDGNAALELAERRLKELEEASNSVGAAQGGLAAEVRKAQAAIRATGDSLEKVADGMVKVTVQSGDALRKVFIVPREIDAAAAEALKAKETLEGALQAPTNSAQQTKAVTDGINQITEANVEAAKVALQGAEQQVKAIETVLAAIPADTQDAGQILIRSQAIRDLNAALADLGTRRQAFADLSLELQNVAKAVPAANKISDPIVEAQNRIATALAEIGRLADATAAGITTAFTGIGQRLEQEFLSSAAAVTLIWDKMVEAMQSRIADLIGTVQGVADAVSGILASIEARIRAVQAQAASAGSSSSGGDDGEGFAGGGAIRGPGGPTADRIPIWASNGEFMIRAAAVRKLGLDFLYLINSGRFSFKDLVQRFSRGMKFAEGGLVTMPRIAMPAIDLGLGDLMMPRFAAGGLVAAAAGSGPKTGLSLTLEGETFAGLEGPSDVIERLDRMVRARKLRSAGRASPYAVR
jgi:hypothetical protein